MVENTEKREAFFDKVNTLLENNYIYLQYGNKVDNFLSNGDMCIKGQGLQMDSVVIRIKDNGDDTYTLESSFLPELNGDDFTLDKINGLIKEKTEGLEKQGEEEEK